MKKELLIKNLHNFYIPFWNNIYKPILTYLSEDTTETGSVKRNEESLPYALAVTSIICGMVEAILIDAYINGKTLTINDQSNFNRKLEKISNIGMSDIKLNIGMFDSCENMVNTYMAVSRSSISRALAPEDPHDSLVFIMLDGGTPPSLHSTEIYYKYPQFDPKSGGLYGNNISISIYKTKLEMRSFNTDTIFDEYSFEEFESMFVAITVLQKAVEIGFIESIEKVSLDNADADEKFRILIDSIEDYVLNKIDLVDEEDYNGSDMKYELKQNMVSTTISMALILHDAANGDASHPTEEDSDDENKHEVLHVKDSPKVSGNVNDMINHTIDYIENMDIVVAGKPQDRLVMPEEVRNDLRKIYEYYTYNQDDREEKVSLTISKFSGILVDDFDPTAERKAEYVVPCIAMMKMKVNEEDGTYDVIKPLRFDDIDPEIREEGSRLREWLRSELIRRGLDDDTLDNIESWVMGDVGRLKLDKKDVDEEEDYIKMSFKYPPDTVESDKEVGFGYKEFNELQHQIDSKEDEDSSTKETDSTDLVDIDKSTISDNYIESLEVLADEIYKNYFCKQLKNWCPIGLDYPPTNIGLHKKLEESIDAFLNTSYGTLLHTKGPIYDIGYPMSFVISLRYGDIPINNAVFEYDEYEKIWKHDLFMEAGTNLRKVFDKNKKEQGLWFIIISKFGYFAEELDYLNVDMNYLKNYMNRWDLFRHVVLAFRMAIDLKLIEFKNTLGHHSEESDDNQNNHPIYLLTKWNFSEVLTSMESMFDDMSDTEQKSFIKLFRKCSEFYKSKSKNMVKPNKRQLPMESSKIRIHLPGNSMSGIRDIIVANNNRAVINNTKRIYDDKSFYIRTDTGRMISVEKVSDISDDELMSNMNKMINYIEYQINHPEEEEVL